MKKKQLTLTFSVVLFLFLTPRPSSADVIYDNLSSGFGGLRWLWGWDQSDKVFEDGSNQLGYIYAVKFTVPDHDYALSAVTLAIAKDISLSPHDNLTVKIVEDNHGQPFLPNSHIVETLAVDPVVPTVRSVVQIPSATLEMPSALNPILKANNPYWITLEPTTINLNNDANDSAYLWYQALPRTTGDIRVWDYQVSSGGWENLRGQPFPDFAAFLVTGEIVTVPEPGGAAWFAGVLLFAWTAGRRRRPIR